MAKKLKDNKDWQGIDAARMEQALKEIERSENLRFFLRCQLAACAVDYTPIGADPIDTARLLGRHQIGTELIQTLRAHRPDLYPKIIKEQQDEQLARASTDDYSGDGNDWDHSAN